MADTNAPLYCQLRPRIELRKSICRVDKAPRQGDSMLLLQIADVALELTHQLLIAGSLGGSLFICALIFGMIKSE